MEKRNGSSRNSKDIEKDMKQQKSLRNSITVECMEYQISKAEKHREKLLSGGYACSISVECSGKGCRMPFLLLKSEKRAFPTFADTRGSF